MYRLLYLFFLSAVYAAEKREIKDPKEKIVSFKKYGNSLVYGQKNAFHFQASNSLMKSRSRTLSHWIIQMLSMMKRLLLEMPTMKTLDFYLNTCFTDTESIKDGSMWVSFLLLFTLDSTWKAHYIELIGKESFVSYHRSPIIFILLTRI